jgi:hypothetical protein
MINIEPNPQKSVSAAYDSVNLINKTILETIDDKKKSLVERNVKHLELMMKKDFFINVLTPEQKTEIESCISSGKAYIS